LLNGLFLETDAGKVNPPRWFPKEEVLGLLCEILTGPFPFL